MTPLYLYILLGSLSIPLLFTVFKNDFFKYWGQFFISTLIIASIFLIWDYYFTKNGIWSFNYDYCLGIKMFGMPIEEWLFFFIIPFCSLFIHFAFLSINPNIKLPKNPSKYLSIGLIILSLIVALLNFSKSYTMVNYLVLAIVLLFGLRFFKTLLQQFYITFLIILIPFFIVNGILTGSFIEVPIVNYNNYDNLNIRVFTIPIEDIGYCFSMLFGNLMIFEALIKRNN